MRNQNASGSDGSTFRGDWWMLAFLLRCATHARATDPECIDPERFGIHEKVWRDLRLQRVGIRLECAGLAVAHLAHAHLAGAHQEHAILEGANLAHAVL